MKNFRPKFTDFFCAFPKDEEGSQVVEYALIIAVVSIALVIALQQLTTAGGSFGSFITRVSNCLTTATCI